MASFFDTHCHLNVTPLKENLATIIATMEKKGCYGNIVGIDLATSYLAIKQGQKSPHLFVTIGVHPHEAKNPLPWQQIKTCLRSWLWAREKHKIIALGETGFDFSKTSQQDYPIIYHYQLALLKIHYQLGKEFGLPLILHVRNAEQEMLRFLKTNPHFGIIHCFNQDWHVAKQYLQLGWYLSIPGIVTFHNANNLQAAIKQIPLSKIVIETDSPWLAPVPYRGKTNYPYYGWEVIKMISAIKNLPLDLVRKEIWNNTIKVFRLKPLSVL